jgi:hypothetical protein
VSDPTTPAGGPPADRPRRWGLARAREVAAPVGRTLLFEPYEQGRLRLEGAPPVADRTLAMGALIALVALLGVLAFGDAFRHGTLVRLADTSGRWAFVPLSLLPIVVVGVFFGWLSFLWGAMRCGVLVAVAAALTFLIVNGPIGRVSGGVGEGLVVRWAPTLGRVGYVVTAGVVVLYAFVSLRSSWGRRAKPVALPLLFLALAAMFGPVLWTALYQFSHGIPPQTTLTLDGTFGSITVFLEPMLLLAAVALVDFAYSFANAVTAPALELRGRTVKIAVAALIGAKLWITLVRHRDEWGSYLRVSPTGLVWVGVSVGALAAVASAWRRHLRRRPVSEAEEESVKELLIYVGIAAEALLGIIVLALTNAGASIAVQTGSRGAAHFVNAMARFSARHAAQVRSVPWAVLLLVGLVLLLRSGSHRRRELALGLVLLGAWNLPFFVLATLHVHFQYSNPLLDIVVTVAAGVALIVRWRHVDRFEAVALGVVVVFSWMAFTRGDFVSAVASTVLSPFGITSAVVVVFGIAYSLVADSAFTANASRAFPRGSRVLLWLGYLTLSTAALAWLAITHSVDTTITTFGVNGFADIGIPLAAWLVIRRPLTRREAEVEALPAEAAAFEVDDEEPPPAPIFTE